MKYAYLVAGVVFIIWSFVLPAGDSKLLATISAMFFWLVYEIRKSKETE